MCSFERRPCEDHPHGGEGPRADRGYQIPRYSDLYFANYRNASVDELGARGIEIGGYDFKHEDEWLRRREGLTETELEERVRELTRWALKAPTFGEAYRTRRWSAAWTPRVVVVTSASTYSAGFDLAAALHRRGAWLAGVPSSQAGNCFIDTLGFELPHSGLRGNLSYERSLLFPDDPEKGKVLRPDAVLTYERFAAVEFDPHAAVLLALEMIADAY